MSLSPVPVAEVSHNQIGQKLGRKGQETRERILAAVLRLLADPDGPPVTLAGVAKEAHVRPTNVYLYFPDLGALLLAALARVMDTAEEAYLARLRTPWPCETLYENCLAFLQAHYEFWTRNGRLLHMRNAMADASDLRVLRYRNDATKPLIDLLASQMGEGGDPKSLATVLLTGLERVATVVTNPQFSLITGAISETDHDIYIRALLEAEAEVLAVVIANRRTMAKHLPQRQSATR